jgi:carbonic anhydrase
LAAIDHFREHSLHHPARFPGPLPAEPSTHVAIVTCMDARIDVYRLFGLQEGQAHVIRNAGGVVTEDILRSLAISQRRLGTREILLMHHTRCGLLGFPDEEFQAEIREETGRAPGWEPRTLRDLDEDLREAIAGLQADPVVPHTEVVRGFVYDVDTGEVREVTTA